MTPWESAMDHIARVMTPMNYSSVKGYLQIKCPCPYVGLQLARCQLGRPHSWHLESVLKNMDDSFMVQIAREPTRKYSLLDLLLVNQVSHEW